MLSFSGKLFVNFKFLTTFLEAQNTNSSKIAIKRRITPIQRSKNQIDVFTNAHTCARTTMTRVYKYKGREVEWFNPNFAA